ncbi:hypothetical protein [Janthinobacterium sp. RA13]|uniref:hypothetical protein n=2 Tax=unclassified Janthinobacterium TaxID=2610881 RepID=UPI00126A0FD2|nr:hypothetical protein [Janthinobacterium sp. RA13]
MQTINLQRQLSARSGRIATFIFLTWLLNHLEVEMASLLHEVWEEEDGITVCIANGSRPEFMTADARFIATFEASSWTEAMTKYYEMYDFGVYKPFDSSSEPYSEESKARQIDQLKTRQIRLT